jgi:hypothetical protein
VGGEGKGEMGNGGKGKGWKGWKGGNIEKAKKTKGNKLLILGERAKPPVEDKMIFEHI